MTLNEILKNLELKTKQLQNNDLDIEQAIIIYKECQELIKQGNLIIEKAKEEIQKANKKEI